MSDSSCSVIVAGAGPAGLALANLLGHYKVRTLVLEKEPGLSPLPKALNIDDEFFRLLVALGLQEQLRAHAKFPISYSYISPLGLSLGYVRGQFTEHNAPNRAAIFQPEFERILCDAALATGYVQVEFQQEVLALKDSGDHVVVTTRAPDGSERHWRSDFLVGADGAHSACRKLLGIPFDEVEKFDVRHVVVDVRDDVDDSANALTKMGWRRNFFSMPAPNGRRFEFSLRPNEKSDDLLQDATLRALFKPWRNYDELQVIRKVVHTFRSRIARRLSLGRVFLIGDAAHLMPVFGSQGMNSGVRDANNLAWKLAQVIHREAPLALLDSYHDERWPAVLKTIRMATINGRVQRVKSPGMSLLRDLFFGLLRLVPPATRYIRDMKYIPKPFLRSALVQPGAETGRRDEYIGRLHPNPSIAGAAGMTLDDLLGTGFAIVGVDPAEPAPPGIEAAAKERGASLVVVYPQVRVGVPGQPSSARVAVVVDRRYEALFRLYAGRWLLVRPDRVIALASPAGTLIETLDRFGQALLPRRLHRSPAAQAGALRWRVAPASGRDDRRP
jgi:3-(3-hydroxy-phenyl)propionate hydroxylase